MIIYPGAGLGRYERPRLAFTLGYDATLLSSLYDLFIQIEGQEPSTAVAGMGAAALQGVEPSPDLTSLRSTSPLGASTTAPGLSGEEPPPPLSGREPSLESPQGSRLALEGSEPQSTVEGEEADGDSGKEYDSEQSGRERGWPKN